MNREHYFSSKKVQHGFHDMCPLVSIHDTFEREAQNKSTVRSFISTPAHCFPSV